MTEHFLTGAESSNTSTQNIDGYSSEAACRLQAFHATPGGIALTYDCTKKVSYVKSSEYDQEIPQSHTADQPTAP